MPPNRNWHPDPLPATKNRALAGRVFTLKAYKNRGFSSSTTLPAISLRGLGAGQPGTAADRKWIALRPDTHRALQRNDHPQRIRAGRTAFKSNSLQPGRRS
jgi:hypothetical protein